MLNPNLVRLIRRETIPDWRCRLCEKIIDLKELVVARVVRDDKAYDLPVEHF